MGKYNVFFRESVRKDFRTIPKKDVARILQRINEIIEEPRPQCCEKLTSQERYRLRQGRYRIMYSIQNNEHIVWIVKIAARKDAYR